MPRYSNFGNEAVLARNKTAALFMKGGFKGPFADSNDTLGDN